VARERAQSFLKPEHQAKILDAYQNFVDQPGFAAVVTNEETLAQSGNLSIPRYVKKAPKSESADETQSLSNAWISFEDEGREFWTEMDSLAELLDGVAAEEASDA
jgi:type I restriction enzyme M protein